MLNINQMLLDLILAAGGTAVELFHCGERLVVRPLHHFLGIRLDRSDSNDVRFLGGDATVKYNYSRAVHEPY